MKIKLKKDKILPNNWKSCGHTAKDWEDLNNGKTIDVGKVPELIEDYIDVVSSGSTASSKPKNKGVK